VSVAELLTPSHDQQTSAPTSTPAGAPAAAGDLAELLRAFNDVTARLQGTHEQLRAEVNRLTRELSDANEQLERSRRLAALGEMAAGISHEVRNPLGSIALYARMLDQDLVDRPEQRKIAGKIATAAKGLDAIVGDVLTFSREFKLRPTDVVATEAFDAALESCLHDGVPGWRTVNVVRRDRAAGNVRVRADHSLLQQVLVNIIRNAIEAMESVASSRDAGTSQRVLTLAIRRTTAECAATGQFKNMVTLSVSDTGPGISDDVKARMFNPFFTTRSTGTGLGLAIVHRIMDAHGGRITVRDNRPLSSAITTDPSADSADPHAESACKGPRETHGGGGIGTTVELCLEAAGEYPATEIEAHASRRGAALISSGEFGGVSASVLEPMPTDPVVALATARDMDTLLEAGR
jgi:signal transduction histidine kinase